jgi:hypothetical protein
MKRMPVGFTDDQRAALEREAKRRNVSVGRLVREAVEEAYLSDAERRRQAHIRSLAYVGKFHDIAGKTDVAERHDDYVADAYWADLERNRPR